MHLFLLPPKKKLAAKLSDYYSQISDAIETLEADTLTAEKMGDVLAAAQYYHETILPDMDAVRLIADKAEEYIPDSLLPYPNYEKLLFTV